MARKSHDGAHSSLPFYLKLHAYFRERYSLLKKSLSDRSVVRYTQDPRPKLYKTVDLNA